MKKETIILSIITLIIGVIIGGLVFSKTKIINNTDNDSLTKCQSDLSNCNLQSSQQNIATKNYDVFDIDLDFLGARGNEVSGFGNGWIDEEDCIKSNVVLNKNYKSCKIQYVQLFFGSEPNPFKSENSGYTGGTIFGNGAVFRVRCSCEY